MLVELDFENIVAFARKMSTLNTTARKTQHHKITQRGETGQTFTWFPIVPKVTE